MSDMTETLVKTLREEFQNLSVQLRKELKDERDNLSRRTSIGHCSWQPEANPLRDAALEVPSWNQPLESIRPMIATFTPDVDSWDSARPISNLQHKQRVRAMLQSIILLEAESAEVLDLSAQSDSNVLGNVSQNIPTAPSTCFPERLAIPCSIDEEEIHLHGSCGQAEPVANSIAACNQELLQNVEHAKKTADTKEPIRRKWSHQHHKRGQKALGIAGKASTKDEIAQHVGKYSCFRNKAISIVTHWFFDHASVMLILTNTIMIGISTDYMAREKLEDEPSLVIACEIIMCMLFVAELTLRLIAWQWYFFTMHGWAWNVFDFFVTLTQLTEVFVQVCLRKSVHHESSLVRLVRAFRLLRVLRVLKIMKFIEELQLLVGCVLKSSKGFMWALFLLLLLSYACSIYVCQLTTSAIVDGHISSVEQGRLENLYGSIPASLLSIIQGLLGGMDWEELVNPIKNDMKNGTAKVILVIIFILFAILVVLNVITGSFVQTALEGAQEIKMVHRLNYARKMFRNLDLDKSGVLTLDEIGTHLQDPIVQAFFDSMDVDISEAHSLFKLIDMDKSGVIEIEEFLLGCVRLQGPAKATDLLLVTSDIRRTFEMHWLALEAIEKHLCNVGSAMHSFLAGGNARVTST